MIIIAGPADKPDSPPELSNGNDAPYTNYQAEKHGNNWNRWYPKEYGDRDRIYNNIGRRRHKSKKLETERVAACTAAMAAPAVTSMLRQLHKSFSNPHIRPYYHSQTAIIQAIYEHAYQQGQQATSRQEILGGAERWEVMARYAVTHVLLQHVNSYNTNTHQHHSRSSLADITNINTLPYRRYGKTEYARWNGHMGGGLHVEKDGAERCKPAHLAQQEVMHLTTLQLQSTHSSDGTPLPSLQAQAPRGEKIYPVVLIAQHINSRFTINHHQIHVCRMTTSARQSAEKARNYTEIWLLGRMC